MALAILSIHFRNNPLCIVHKPTFDNDPHHRLLFHKNGYEPLQESDHLFTSSPIAGIFVQK